MPWSRSSVAASTSAPSAANANAPPTETRLTPAAARSLTGGTPAPATTFTGRSTADTICLMSARLFRPGAYSTSAPAAWYACSRAMVSARSGRPCRKFSARAVSTRRAGPACAASAAAATRSAASLMS